MNSKERFEQILKAIELERKHEENYYSKIIALKTIKERIEAGVVWYPIEITKTNYTIGEYVEVEVIKSKDHAHGHKFKEGMGVNLFYSYKDETKKYGGHISLLRRDKMRIILSNDLMDKNEVPSSGLIGVEMVYDERPYKVMRNTIKDVIKTTEPNLLAFKAVIDKPEGQTRFLSPPPFYSKQLNESQNQAINTSLSAPTISIIHGPPGTGKTTTLVHLIKHAITYLGKILVCAPSNSAADLLAVQLDEIGVKVLRSGNVTRIADKVTHLTLEEMARGSNDWQHIKKVKIQAEEAAKMGSKFRRSFGQHERRERIMYRKEARQLRSWARDLEDKLTNDIIDQTPVIVSTLIGSASRNLSGVHFDLLIIDEASQTLEAECWTAMRNADRLIMAGDHKQLPPTVKSEEAKSLGLAVTLLDILYERSNASSLLNIQYRMNDAILSFSNKEFYDNQLTSSDSVKNRILSNLPPLTFIDTAGTGFNEELNEEYRSLKNEGEYFILREHLMKNIEEIRDYEIGIISPYAQQVRYVRTQIAEDDDLKVLNIEVNSIDGFQGQEKDLIYISLVRSNDQGIIGFLKDERRLNVAMTRAKMALILIGDSGTLTQHEIFKKLLDHIEFKLAYQSAWEYMA